MEKTLEERIKQLEELVAQQQLSLTSAAQWMGDLTSRLNAVESEVLPQPGEIWGYEEPHYSLLLVTDEKNEAGEVLLVNLGSGMRWPLNRDMSFQYPSLGAAITAGRTFN